MTKFEMFAHIAKTVNEKEVKDFCKHEMELLKKKSGSSKPTKNQQENAKYKNIILDVLNENGKPMTISQMLEDSRLSTLKNQRLSAIVSQMKRDGQVVRNEIKKVAYFSLPIDNDSAEDTEE